MNNINPIITKISETKRAYLPHTDKLPLVVVNYIWNDLLKNESDKTKALFCILRKETELCLRKNEGYAPISWKLLEKNKYTEAIKRLKELDLVDYIEYVRPRNGIGGASREYRIKLPLFYYISDLQINRAEVYIRKGFILYNGVTGKAIKNKKASQHEITKYNKFKKKDELIVSEIVAQGIIPIKYCYFNYILAEEHLDFMKEQNKLGLLDEREILSYMNDEHCYANILSRPFKLLDGCNKGLLIYQPSYKADTTGRKSEIGGGFQSCSRTLKHLAFAYAPNVKNYDLKSSQIYCLKYQFMSARLNYSLLEDYMKADKKLLASNIGIDVDTWKGINYGAYFGGFPTLFIKNFLNSDKKHTVTLSLLAKLLSYKVVYKHICNHLNIKVIYNTRKKRREVENPSVEIIIKILKILKDFYIQNKDLLHEILIWHEYLGKEFIQSNSIDIKHQKFIRNRSDMPLEISKFMNKKSKLSNEGKRKLASHLLQGQEAHFISKLTWYSEIYPDCPYSVMSDQRDGLIVEGYIPEEYVQMARNETGFTDAYLLEKPYD